MLIKEYYKTLLDGRELYKFYSDLNLYIMKTTNNYKYIEAIDVEEKENLFVETEEKIPDDTLKFKSDIQKETT